MLERSRKSNDAARRTAQASDDAARLTVAVFVLLMVLAFPVVAYAQVNLGLEYATTLGLPTVDIRVTIGRIINAFLGFLGLVAVVLFLYAGFRWMTAGGNDQQIAEAKRIMINATIGLVIIFSAYAITAFIFRAVTGQGLLGTVGTTGGGTASLSAYRSGTSGALGSGIIDYHYPEIGQVDVPRNTNIAITFKRPVLLSTVIEGYDDAGTFDTADDTAPAELRLNTANFKLIANADLDDPGTGTSDDQFGSRYAGAITDPAPFVRLTDVTLPFDANEMQTVVITPAIVLGSPSSDITYRVAIRGGDNGVRVWAPDPGTGAPTAENAFDVMNADGGYFWPFATGTVIDNTPPRISGLWPIPVIDPGSRVIPRNQLLQIYFDEAVDPTTASGLLGTGGGFNNIEIQARCLAAQPSATFPCTFNGGNSVDFSTIDGTLVLANRYRTAEFVPLAECEGVVENSCGEKVYCLPKNVAIRVRTKSATVDESQPPKAIASNGVLDMSGNSFDGNRNGTAEGPGDGSTAPYDRITQYSMNNPPSDLAMINDTAFWNLHAHNEIDLVPPFIREIDPLSPPPFSDLYLDPSTGSVLGGPSAVPGDTPVTVTWSKVMSVGSMRTGGFCEGRTGDTCVQNTFTDERSTVVIRARERANLNEGADCATEDCPYEELDPPSFSIDAGTGPLEDAATGDFYTDMKIRHRPFFTANDLGYTENDITVLTDRIPLYQPVIRAKIKDTAQNCFFPSEGYLCGTDTPNASCCNRSAMPADADPFTEGTQYDCPF